MSFFDSFIATWLSILVGLGIFTILALLAYCTLSKYIVWVESKDEEVEIDKMRRAMGSKNEEMEHRR